jgi:uncharacterized protein
VIEIGTLEDAIYYLTGYRLQTPSPSSVDDSVFKEISRNLFNAVYSYYNQTIGRGYVDTALINKLKAEEKYYTAASLIFQGIRQYYQQQASSSRRAARTLYDQALQMAKEAEAELTKIPVTINNVDLVVASYTRIYEVYLRANSTSPDAGAMYARAVTLKPWVEEARKMAYGAVLNESMLAEVARMYLDYAKTMYAYVETTYRITSGDYGVLVQLAEDLYSKGLYLASMANSIEVIARSASALMAAAPDKYLEVARSRALINMARAAQCGYTNTLPLSYLQFGDYYSSQERDKQLALTHYIMASVYSTAMGDAACAARGKSVYQKPSLEAAQLPAHEVTLVTTTRTTPTDGEEEKGVWISVLIALLAVFALVYASRR